MTVGALSKAVLPRLSEAQRLLPLLRGHLVSAAARRPLATTFDVEPIVEDELFGYELVPDRKTQSYLIIGCNPQGAPVLRETSYSMGSPAPMKLVSIGGRLLSRSGRTVRNHVRGRDYQFTDWIAAAEATWARLLNRFPDRPQRRPIQCADRYCFEQALAIAHTHLARWDPLIEFFGLPKGAQLGFALAGSNGECGQLSFSEPNMWTLRWNASSRTVRESWSVDVDSPDVSDELTPGDLHYSDRRTDPRRIIDCNRLPDRRIEMDRRQGRPRRAMDQRRSSTA
jgi:hypothetical protein